MSALLDRVGMPLLRLLPPESAHRLTIWALRKHLVGGPAPDPETDPPILRSELCGLRLSNPIGLAAGFDKDAQAIGALFGLGFGHVEVGTVTPKPQPGNPRPRLFRLPEDRAVINRMGFNNEGAAAVAQRLQSWRGARRPGGGLIGVNIGKNKDSESAAGDYSLGATRFARLADYMVVNLSSPNTPGLRRLQERDALVEILEHTRSSLQADWKRGGGDSLGGKPPPLFLKIAPDLTERQILDIADVAMNAGLIEGLVICNTSVARPVSLRNSRRNREGGLSGQPISGLSTALIARVYTMTHGRVPIIGVGGVASGQDAYDKILAGASLVQLYTGMVFEGPGLIARIKRDLATLLEADGFNTVAEAVGAAERDFAEDVDALSETSPEPVVPRPG